MPTSAPSGNREVAGNLRPHIDRLAEIAKRKRAAEGTRDRITARTATVNAALLAAQEQRADAAAKLRKASAVAALADDEPEDARLPQLRADEQTLARKEAALRDAVDGLVDELKDADAAIEATERERIEAIREAVLDCVDEPMADYAAAARELVSAFRRVIAIQQIARDLGVGVSAFRPGLSEAWIPNLASGIDGCTNDYFFQPRLDHLQPEVTAAERERLRSMGIYL